MPCRVISLWLSSVALAVLDIKRLKNVWGNNGERVLCVDLQAEIDGIASKKGRAWTLVIEKIAYNTKVGVVDWAGLTRPSVQIFVGVFS